MKAMISLHSYMYRSLKRNYGSSTLVRAQWLHSATPRVQRLRISQVVITWLEYIKVYNVFRYGADTTPGTRLPGLGGWPDSHRPPSPNPNQNPRYFASPNTSAKCMTNRANWFCPVHLLTKFLTGVPEHINFQCLTPVNFRKLPKILDQMRWTPIGITISQLRLPKAMDFSTTKRN